MVQDAHTQTGQAMETYNSKRNPNTLQEGAAALLLQRAAVFIVIVICVK